MATDALYRCDRCGIHQEMRRDANVLYFGQNLATTENHAFVAAYGPERVRVTPISETAEIGIAVGVAMPGSARFVELYMAESCSWPWTRSQRSAPISLHDRRTGRGPVGTQGGYGFTAAGRANTRARSPRCSWGFRDSKWWCLHRRRRKGLMATAIRDDNPVVYLHHYMFDVGAG